MIVIDRGNGSLVLVHQGDHARLSGQIASQWVKPAAMFEGVWRRLLEAIATHDDGWVEAEGEPALDAGGCPFDFVSLPTHQHIEIWRRSIELAARRDVYQALLVAHHARWLYTNYSNHHGAWEQAAAAGFIGELTQRIVEYMQLLRRGNAEDRDAVEPCRMATATTLLSFFDSLSLLLIGALPPQQRLRPVVFDGRQSAIELEWGQGDGGAVRCRPWPFIGGRVEGECPVYRVAKSRFAEPAELGGRLAGGPTHRQRWALEPAS